MKRPRVLLLTFTLALATSAGLVVFEARHVSAQRAQLDAQRERHAALTRELADLRRQQERAAHDLQAAERQLSQLPAVSVTLTPTPNSPAPASPHASAATAWLARTKQLRELAAQSPNHAIPELSLLRDADWLRVARDAAFDTDIDRRKALAALRSAAKREFVARLSAATQKFAASDLTKTPSAASELAAFFTPPVDPAILPRYEVTPPRPESGRSALWRIQEIAPVDEDFDVRHYVDVHVTGDSHHGTAGTGPTAWIDDFSPRLRRAHQAYTAANPSGKPTSLAHVLPYMQPPLPPATVEKLLKAERDRHP